MKLFLPTLILLFSIHASTAQNLNLTNQKSIGGSGDDVLPFILKTPTNDGYFLVGNSTSGISGDKSDTSRGYSDVWLVRTDTNFNVLWDKTYGGNEIEQAYGAIIQNNKIYIHAWSSSGISGEKTIQNYGAADCWMLCLDVNGNILWQNAYGGDWTDWQGNLTDYSDSSLLISCLSSSGISGNKSSASLGYTDYWLIEVSKIDGHIINQKTIGTVNDENVNISCQKSPYNNHTYAFGVAEFGTSGTKTDPGLGMNDFWIIELDENLNVIQDKCFGGNEPEGEYNGSTSIKIVNQDIFVAGASASGISGNKSSPNYGVLFSYDIWLIKLDHSLNLIWDKTYGGNGNESGRIAGVNQNGHIIIASTSDSPISGVKTSPKYGGFFDNDSWILILDQSGNILTQNTFGGTENESGSTTIENPYSANQLIFSTYSSSNISGNKTVTTNGGTDTWIAKIDASAYLGLSPLNKESAIASVYPNPVQNELNFSFSELKEKVEISFISMDGKILDRMVIQPGESIYKWYTADAPDLFYYEIKGNSVLQQGKIVKH